MLGHAEAELDSEVVFLVKLRNPWGRKEWLGDWSDTSGRWSKAMCDAVGYQPDANDGVFYMSLKDVREVYNYVVWVEIFPTSWEVQRIKGRWTETSCGGCTNNESWWNNPQYHLHVPLQVFDERTTVHIGLTQGDSKYSPDRDSDAKVWEYSIGFSIFKTRDLETPSLVRIKAEQEVIEEAEAARLEAIEGHREHLEKFKAKPLQRTVVRETLSHEPKVMVVVPTYEVEEHSTKYTTAGSNWTEVHSNPCGPHRCRDGIPNRLSGPCARVLVAFRRGGICLRTPFVCMPSHGGDDPRSTSAAGTISSSPPPTYPAGLAPSPSLWPRGRRPGLTHGSILSPRT